MQTRSDAQRTLNSPYAVGCRVFGAIDGVAGTVIAVTERMFTVEWTDGSFPVEYPEGSNLVRRGLPWET